MATPLMELRRITRTFETRGQAFTAVENVSLTLAEGEFVALLGPSGCGKSTLVRIIAGLTPPTTGDVFYRGVPLVGVNSHASIVFQTFALFPWLTVQQNVEVALKARGVPRNLRVPRAVDLLDRVGLDGFESAYPRELSGGMRQKVGFARAMAVEPELLCLDEPFSALDVLSAAALRKELLDLWIGGRIPTKAILLVTHNIEEAVLMADRIVVMEKGPGRIVAEVPVAIPQPRNRKGVAFQQLVDQVYALLAGQTEPEESELGPGAPGPTRPLPHVAAGQLTGFLEHLAQLPEHRADLYRLADELHMDSDRVLQLAEAAEVLGFGTLAHGDITLTPLGATFAETGIQTRKEIFAARVRRVPLLRWLLGLLAAADEHVLERDVVESALGLEFPPEEATRQIETAIGWGRYAELLAYDAGSGTIHAEPGAGVAGNG